MALSKKHYEQFAYNFSVELERVKNTTYYSAGERTSAKMALLSLAHSMAVNFALDNSAFQRDRFLAACNFDKCGF